MIRFRKNRNKIYLFITLLLLIPSLLLNAYFVFRRKKDGTRQGVRVVKVIDGDTFEIEGNQRIRLRQVDAPEMGLCGSEESKKFLTGMVEGKSVTLTEAVIGQQNRPLALVYAGKTLVNLEILKNGWARYHHDASSQKEILQAAGNQAKSDRVGIYGPECYGKTPDDPECLIKGNIDKATGTKIYYYPGCPQYEFTLVEKDLGEAWFCTTKEAEEAGYVRAKNCP